MAVPTQVRNAGAEAERRIRELNPSVAADSQADPAPPTNQDDTPLDPAPPAPAPLDPAPTPAPTTPPEDTATQRYNTLQGMYAAAQRNWNAEAQTMRDQIAQLQQLVSTMQAPSPAAAEPSLVDGPSEITDEHRREYGDSIDLMMRASRQVLQPVVARLSKVESDLRELREGVVPTVQNVVRHQATTAEDLFLRDLSAMLPDWQQINSNPDFHAWLLQAHPMIGVTRQALLEDAHQKFDAARVAHIFQSWPGYTATPTTPAPVDPRLQAQVAPGRSKAAPAPSGGQPKTWTRAEIAKFFDDVRAGRYVGREKEKALMESDIFAANREGRVQ